MNKPAENDDEVITKAYVDQFHQENERSGRDLGLGFYDESDNLVKNNQDNDFFDNDILNVSNIQNNNNPGNDNHGVKKNRLII